MYHKALIATEFCVSSIGVGVCYEVHDVRAPLKPRVNRKVKILNPFDIGRIQAADIFTICVMKLGKQADGLAISRFDGLCYRIYTQLRNIHS